MNKNNSHNLAVGYLLWLLGFTGAHRFYYGRPISGTIWFFTGGLFLVGWLIDLFLIPSMDESADLTYKEGTCDYTIAWMFLTFLGVFGVHRFYQKKILSGLVYLFTGGIFLVGILYDYWTLNEQLDEVNRDQAFI